MARIHLLERSQRVELPIAAACDLADRLLVRRDLKQIFDYRRDAVARELGGEPAGDAP